jgi:hypothetical protein
VPSGSNITLVLIGFPLGFFASGCFSGFGAFFPGIIGFLAATVGLGGAVAFGVFGYVLAIGALRFLPETNGKELVPVE